MKKLLILAIVLSLCGCSVMEKISNKPYWEEVCIEPYAYYDSCHQMPKKFMISARTMIYMTDSTNTMQCNIIWGDTCVFVPGEMLYVRWHRSHSPSTGTAGWRATLINHKEQLTYHLYD